MTFAAADLRLEGERGKVRGWTEGREGGRGGVLRLVVGGAGGARRGV